MLTAILPVSSCAEGLRSDSSLGKGLERYALESVHEPKLIISARDGGYDTFASSQYLVGQIAGSTFVGFDDGGHTWAGHDGEVESAILKLVRSQAFP